MLLSTKRLSMSCSGTIDTWVDEALNVLHHQLTGQTDGMLEVSRGHVPVRMVFMATAKPKGHHRKEKVNNCIDAKPWSWKRKVSIRIVILAPLLQQNGSAKWRQRASHLFSSFAGAPHSEKEQGKRIYHWLGNIWSLVTFFFFVSAWF